MPDSNVKISGVVITYNEEKNIARCMESLLPICEEIVVVDSFSTDDTKQICLKYEKVKFVENPFEGHIEQKNFALTQAFNEVVLSLDADEAVSEELAKSILEVKENWKDSAYKFNRFTNYCGQWIKHSGWYPDTKVRLWEKSKGNWGGLNPHDSVELNGDLKAVHLKGNLLHYSYYTLSEHVERSMKYAKISAYALHKRNKKSSISQLIFNPIYRFIQDYILRLGFLDGFYGLIICSMSGYTTFLKYAYLRSLNGKKPIE